MISFIIYNFFILHPPPAPSPPSHVHVHTITATTTTLHAHDKGKERKGAGGRKPSPGQGKPVSKKRLPHRLLSNSTWQHPSTLLGHTSSAYTPNPPLSISPSDDPADLLGGPFARLPGGPYDLPAHEPPVSDAVEALEGFEDAEDLSPSPRNLSIGLVNSRFVALHWQEPDLVPGAELANYLVYYRQEGFERSVSRPKTWAFSPFPPARLDSLLRMHRRRDPRRFDARAQRNAPLQPSWLMSQQMKVIVECSSAIKSSFSQ
jgi:hypothetical protein